MKHKIFHNVKILVASTILFNLILTSCHDDTPSITPTEDKTTVLLYAIASNNLYSNLIDDKNEILSAAETMDLKGLNLLLYQVTPNGNPQLLELKRMKNGSYDYEIVKEYDKEIYSTDPERISEVIDNIASAYPSNLYGLILWSHGTGLDPFTSSRSSEDSNHPVLRSFGADKNPDKDSSYSDQINIDELADAIPDNLFNFIWFDACYMSGIETIYELRDKCQYFVGYPTEVFTPGMPYHKTLPYILNERPDLTSGAEMFFNYYSNYSSSSMRVATVCVVDMNKLEEVADICKEIYTNNSTTPSKSELLNYTRGSIGPFYDFGQYTRLKALNNDASALCDKFKEKLNEMIIYSAATDVDFNYHHIEPDKFSGISCHYFVDDDSSKAQFYKTLDWYKRVY